MDYLFLFLISTGFVAGVFKGLKRSLKSFLSMIITFAFFSFIFIPLKDFVISQGFLKSEIADFIEEKVSTFGEFGQEFLSIEDLTFAISNSSVPSVFKNILLNYLGKNNAELKICTLIGGVVYEFIVMIVLAIVVFIAVNLVVNFILSILFVKFKNVESNIFVTKTFLSGCVGIMKGMLVFTGIEFVLLFIGGYLQISEIQNFVQSSNIGSITYGLISNQVLSFLS